MDLLIQHYEAEERELAIDYRVNEVVRTYNEKENRVSDKRLTNNYDYDRILEGKDLGKLVEELQLNERV